MQLRNNAGVRPSFNVAAGKQATVSSRLGNFDFNSSTGTYAEAAGLTKDNAGSLILLSTASDYSGGTIVHAGTLQIGNGTQNSAYGMLGRGDVTINNGGTVLLGAITR